MNKNDLGKSCVAALIDSNGRTVYKIFGELLAHKWRLKIVFTGTWQQCADFQHNKP